MGERPLSILHFSTADIIGGSARSAYRIHSGLRAAGHRSRMLVGIKASNDPDVDTIQGGSVSRFADRIANKVSYTLGFQYQFVPSSLTVPYHAWVRDADIIQLYNIHGGYFSLPLIAKLTKIKPVAWRLSDLWPMTGHCAYPSTCDRWRVGCGECPDLESYPSINKDSTAYLFKKKEDVYRRSSLNIIAPSSWMEKCAKESPLLGRFPVTRIPNGLDTDDYRPIDRGEARYKLGIDPSKKVILFAAHILDHNVRKGADILLEAIKKIENPSRYLLMLVGEGGQTWIEKSNVDIQLMGFVSNHQKLADIYSAADVVAIPSAVENLPNVLIEALACGRAVIASDAGGMCDGVCHMETGYLAKLGDATDLAKGLQFVLNDEMVQQKMEKAALILFKEQFTSKIEITRVVDFYRKICEKT